MENIILEIGKKYKTRLGRIVLITKGYPPINGERDGWNGIYWGESIDGNEKYIYNLDEKIEDERFEFNGKHWDYLHRTGVFNNPDLDLIEEIL